MIYVGKPAKVILVYSGGMDSTVLLYALLAQGHEVKCLGIQYGQRHSKELECAETISALRGVPFQLADLSSITPLLGGSSQTDSSIPVPEGHYSEQNMAVTVVPNRNLIMLSVAAAWCISTGSQAVAYAAHAGDHAQYPDCRQSFISAATAVLKEIDWKKIELAAPFVYMSKADIVALGARLGVPFGKTWSCYVGQDKHCGRCGTCVERAEAFYKAGVPDPTEYESPDYFKTVCHLSPVSPLPFDAQEG